jgi:hypothetical protein
MRRGTLIVVLAVITLLACIALLSPAGQASEVKQVQYLFVQSAKSVTFFNAWGYRNV